MSTIASPRPSISLSSRRTSTDTITSTSSKPAPGNAAERGSLRRNRAALRDYYNLKPGTIGDASVPLTPTLDAEQESELDKPNFDPNAYVTNLLATEGLEGVLRVEAGLVSDIRNLDGEKKALVYDNYSKLITATDTIRSMREKMDPAFTPTTHTLTPAIGHIAETAAGLTEELRRAHGGEALELKKKEGARRRQQDSVRWVLAAPVRVKNAVQAGEDGKAREEWEQVKPFLEKWKGVKGAAEVSEACLRALSEGNG